MADNQSPSIVPWILTVIFLLTTITGWFFYYQKDSEFTRSQSQLKRTQQRYDSKVDELYVAWDDLQKSKNEQFQLSDKNQSCETEKEKLAKDLQQTTNSSNNLQSDFKICLQKQQANDNKMATIDQAMSQIKSQMAKKEQNYAKQIAELDKLKELQEEFEQGQSKYQQTLTEQATTIEQLNVQITQQNVELEKKNTEIGQITTSHSDLEKKNHEISNNFKNLESQFNELAAQKIQVNLLKQQLDACKIKTGQSQRKLEELADLRKLREQLVPALGQCKFDLQDSKKNIAQLKQQFEVLNVQLKQEKTKQQTVFDKNSNTSRGLSLCQDKLKQTEEEKSECEKNNSEKINQLNSKSKDKVKTLQENLDNKNKENTILSLQIKSLQEQLQKQQTKSSQCQGEQQKIKQKLSDINNNKEQLSQEIENLKKQNLKCQDSLEQELKNTSQLKTNATKLNQQIAVLNDDKLQLDNDLTTQRSLFNQLQDKLSHLKESQNQTSQQLLMVKQDKSQLSAQLTAIEQEKQMQLKKEQEQLEKLKELLKEEIEAKFVTIKKVEKDSSIRIKITNNLIFNLGDTHISRKGVNILNQVAEVLKKFPKRNIKIIGHTDNIPVKKGVDSYIVSNWELSAARAAAAIRYLQHATKINPSRMHLVGASQYQPIANIDTKTGRAANRRIEICLLSPES